MKVFQVDGGQSVVSHEANSVGVLYPAERLDLVLTWPKEAVDSQSEVIISLDHEYVKPTRLAFRCARSLIMTLARYFQRPNFALTPTQSFTISGESTTSQRKDYNTQRQKLNEAGSTEIVQFDMQAAKGAPLSTPLPEAEKHFMIYTVVQVLAHQNGIPKGFVNHTTWEPQENPLVTLDRDSWDNHQLVPWTGSTPTWVELTINNIDSTGHPFHLVGLFRSPI